MASSAPSPSPLASRWARWWHRARTDCALAGVVLVLAVPVMEPLMAQQASRYALTAALVDHGTVVVDRYSELLTVDRAERDGRLYSDKAPGQPVLAVPAYGLYRLLGGEPGEHYRPYRNTGLWAVSALSAALPAAIGAVLMRRAARRVWPPAALPAALLTAVATMLLPFSTVLFGHVLAGVLLLAAYLCVREPGEGPWRLLAGGFLASLAIAVEYPAALAGPVLAAVAWAERRGGVLWYLLGGVLPGVALAAYHVVTFGGPLTFPYEFSAFALHEEGVLGARLPRPGMLARVLLGERGLFVLTPLVVAGVLGAGRLLADRARRLDGAVVLVTVALFVGLMAGWSSPTAGASPGPRYVVPVLPLLAVGVAEAWRRAPWATGACAAVGVVTMGVATLTLPLAPAAETALPWWIGRLVDGQVADTLLDPVLGTASLPVMAVTALILAYLAWRWDAASADDRGLAGAR